MDCDIIALGHFIYQSVSRARLASHPICHRTLFNSFSRSGEQKFLQQLFSIYLGGLHVLGDKEWGLNNWERGVTWSLGRFDGRDKSWLGIGIYCFYLERIRASAHLWDLGGCWGVCCIFFLCLFFFAEQRWFFFSTLIFSMNGIVWFFFPFLT